MIPHTIADKIKIRLKAQISEISNRCYLLAGKEFIPEGYSFPFIGIVYLPSEIIESKGTDGSRGSRIIHSFDIFIYQSIMDDEALIEGSGSTKGLLELLSDCIAILRDYRFKIELSNAVHLVDVSETYGIEGMIDLGSERYAGVVGFRITYHEYE